MRIVDADALIKRFKKETTTGIEEIGEKQKYVYVTIVCALGFEGIKHIIDEQPTIEERKTGEWCVTPDGMLVCSNCFENPTNRIIVNGSLIYDMTPIREKIRFCPNCGADMRGEEHG